jgi:predicted transcriptional regulator YdeE
VTSDSANAYSIDDKIAYHEEMEYIAIKAGDFTKAEHHRKMQEIYKAMREVL